MESPDPPTTLSVGTLDSLSLRRQVRLTHVQTCSPHHVPREEETPTPTADQGYQPLLTPDSTSTPEVVDNDPQEPLSD